jgi:hypothetical protein
VGRIGNPSYKENHQLLSKEITMSDHHRQPREGKISTVERRQFLAGMSSLAAAAWIGIGDRSSAAESPEATPATMPMIRLGKYRISRLIAGSNPLLGYSYMGPHTDRHMKEYFTTERAVEFLEDCEKAGINAHQLSTVERRGESIRMMQERGSKMHFILLHSQRDKIQSAIEQTHPIAMVHHGGATDRLFAEGQSKRVRDYVKAVRDAGLMAGVSAHNPDCIKRVADEGWEVDFFMTCFYFLTRKISKVKCETPTLQIVYPFFKDDPLKMTEVVRQVEQPCLGFKILAAGRLCANQQMVREAFQFAFSNIKPTDGVIVGMYPRFFDEVNANAGYTRRFGPMSG